MSRSPESLTDAEVIRERDRAALQARINRHGAARARDQAEDSDQPPAEAGWLRQRAEKGEREADRLDSRAERLNAEAQRRGLECNAVHWAECACVRCEEDGSVEVVIGNFLTHALIGRTHVAEAYLAFTEKPRRGPVILGPTRDGLQVPAQRQGRGELVPLLQALIEGIADGDRRGRDPGHGMDRQLVVEKVDGLRAGGFTVEAACEVVGDALGWAKESVRAAYYKQRSRAD